MAAADGACGRTDGAPAAEPQFGRQGRAVGAAGPDGSRRCRTSTELAAGPPGAASAAASGACGRTRGATAAEPQVGRQAGRAVAAGVPERSTRCRTSTALVAWRAWTVIAAADGWGVVTPGARAAEPQVGRHAVTVAAAGATGCAEAAVGASATSITASSRLRGRRERDMTPPQGERRGGWSRQ